MRRCVTILLAAVLLSGMVAAPAPAPARAEAGPNDLLMPLGTQAPDDHLSGYVGAESLLPGDPLRLRVNSPGRTVAVDVYRIGHYGGQGGQRVAHLASQPGVTQPSRTVEAGNMVDCSAWRVTHTRDTTGWQPGAGVRGGVHPADGVVGRAAVLHHQLRGAPSATPPPRAAVGAARI